MIPIMMILIGLNNINDYYIYSCLISIFLGIISSEYELISHDIHNIYDIISLS